MRLVIILFISIYAVSCEKNIQKHPNNKNHIVKHWSYEGETSPEHWAEIEKKSDCDGKIQSPINIIDVKSIIPEKKNTLEILYSPKTILNSVENNGHTITFNFERGDSIKFNGTTYYLKQIHFHEHSEHMINGLIYPIETHLVHVSKNKEVAVLGILGQEGKESQLFEFFESFMPIRMNETKIIKYEQDLNELFPENKDFYSYGGSLTTPPCSENVNWVVFKNPMILSVEEVEKLRKNMPLNNFRNEQELNNRTVYFNASK